MISNMTASRELEVKLAKGLHLVPCSRIAEHVRDFSGEVYIRWNDLRVDAKSIFDLMTLAAPQGTRLLVEVTGDDTESLLDGLEQLFDNDFEKQS